MPRSYVLPLLLVTGLAAAAPAAAQENARQDSARVVERIQPERADSALITDHGDVALLLLGDELRAQFTDQGLDEFRRGDDEGDDSLGRRIMNAMVRAGIGRLLDNAIAIPVAEVHRAEVVDGRLVLEAAGGDQLFDLTMNDRDVMSDFDEREARAFARAVRERAEAARSR